MVLDGGRRYLLCGYSEPSGPGFQGFTSAEGPKALNSAYFCRALIVPLNTDNETLDKRIQVPNILRFLVPNTIPAMVFGTRVSEYRALGPSGLLRGGPLGRFILP